MIQETDCVGIPLLPMVEVVVVVTQRVRIISPSVSQAPDIIERGAGDLSLSPQEVTFVRGKKGNFAEESATYHWVRRGSNLMEYDRLVQSLF